MSNGHTFFIQKLHDIVGVPPVCVHTTYQYGDATTYAYGKRERLRDAHLWLLDTPTSHWRGAKFLRLTSAPAHQLSPSKAELMMPEVIDPHHCVRSHLKLMMLQCVRARGLGSGLGLAFGAWACVRGSVSGLGLGAWAWAWG